MDDDNSANEVILDNTDDKYSESKSDEWTN
jgi:hypothetical protein